MTSKFVLPVLTPDQSSAWDRKAVAAGIELATLMECAGRGVLAALAPRFAAPLVDGVLTCIGSDHAPHWSLFLLKSTLAF